MKTRLFTAIIAFAACVFAVSCSVQKRHYRAGFYVSKTSHKKAAEKTEPRIRQKTPGVPSSIDVSREVRGEAIFASAQDRSVPAVEVPVSRFLRTPPDSCDLVIMRSGEEVSVKILEIDPEFVRYKRCDNLSGPIYTVRKSEIFMLKYANGTREVIKTPAETTMQAQGREMGKSTPQARPAKRLLGMSLFAFLGSLVALMFPIELLALAVLLEIASFIMAIASLNKINKYPDYYSGRVLAILGLIVSTVVLGLLLIALTTV